ncbi:hypothetical protein Taro_047739 [Colocasia esculenta]|uniref:GIR1-like zinc ribbon domain-containing protein n=1 Tax=Colocasia esculenta TaxID=4460 RepID=A0A843X1F2_COLES|nr:hypothetical protein [Colocasia esculenta]
MADHGERVGCVAAMAIGKQGHGDGRSATMVREEDAKARGRWRPAPYLQKKKSAMKRNGVCNGGGSANNNNNNSPHRTSSSSSSPTSPPSSCVSSKTEQGGRCSGSPEAMSMVLVGCPRCLMYMMLSEDDPKCPKCKSTVLLDFLNDPKNALATSTTGSKSRKK